jgi:hypothetical protein
MAGQHPYLTLKLDGDGAWPDLVEKRERGELIHVTGFELGALAAGMGSGLPSIALRIDLPDGRVVIAESSLRLFLTAYEALVIRFGDPRHDAERAK